MLDYRDWHVPLGRRFRALKLWAVIRWYGADGLRAHIRGHVALAQEFASWVAADDRFELVAPHPLALVTFRLRAGDDATLALMQPGERLGRAVPDAHGRQRAGRAAPGHRRADDASAATSRRPGRRYRA